MSSVSQGILAIGDCITSGVSHCLGNSYPERVGMALNVRVKNCGKAMCSSREGITLLRDNESDEFDCVFIQFGLKDAYSTFKYSPNILYYPDNFMRKQLRSIVKKYKKICKKIGLIFEYHYISVSYSKMIITTKQKTYKLLNIQKYLSQGCDSGS